MIYLRNNYYFTPSTKIKKKLIFVPTHTTKLIDEIK